MPRYKYADAQDAYVSAIEQIRRAQKDQSERLDLSYYGLEKLPPEIGHLPQLRYLELLGNRLTRLPDEIGQLHALESLSLRVNMITELPAEIGRLDQLQSLSLSGNKLMELPEEIGRLHNLVFLYISNNQLEKLPSALCQLETLQALNLRSNQLTELCPEIGRLKHLRFLDLRENQLSHLPETIQDLKALTVGMRGARRGSGLRLGGNAFPHFPPEVFRMPPGALIRTILEFQRAEAAGDAQPLNEAKIIFIGDGNVGKTSLIKRLVGDDFDPQERKTWGIQIREGSLELEENQVKTYIWDLGGQEIMHATHRFFMTDRTAYVLVVTPRSEDQGGLSRMDYWLKHIQSYAGEQVPILVVLNKCDVHKMHIGKGSLKDKYPNIVGFLETSSATGQGMEELSRMVAETVEKLDHIDDEIPSNWLTIKEALEANNANYVSYQDFESLCRKKDASLSTESMRSLAHLLHDLGIMLNFQDEFGELADTHVLNPEWVTNGVYSVITHPSLIEKKGVLTAPEIAAILKAHPQNLFPESAHWRLISQIMKKFELAFQMAGQADHFFIPVAFPKDPPEHINWDYPLSEQLRFEYHYEVLPSGIISRLMVQIHAFIKENAYWRYGAILQKDDCMARIQADPLDNILRISVAGSGQQRSLLSYLRGAVEELHLNYKMEINSMVPVLYEGNEALLDYEELKFYEEMGENSLLVRELRARIDIRPILEAIDGWEAHWKDKIRTMLIQGQREEAMDWLVDHKADHNEVIMIAAQWTDCRKRYRNGELSDEEYQVQINRLTRSLQEWLGEAKE